jgi:hypothetical protein
MNEFNEIIRKIDQASRELMSNHPHKSFSKINALGETADRARSIQVHCDTLRQQHQNILNNINININQEIDDIWNDAEVIFNDINEKNNVLNTNNLNNIRQGIDNIRARLTGIYNQIASYNAAQYAHQPAQPPAPAPQPAPQPPAPNPPQAPRPR